MIELCLSDLANLMSMIKSMSLIEGIGGSRLNYIKVAE